MKRKITALALLACAAMLLTGCSMHTVEEMYALPKRSDEYSQLQTAIDRTMVGLDYSAPISGENQQSVQTADLDGDGQEEYLVFASGSWENPLQVLIFKQGADGTCDLVDIIESNGTAFEQVEYVPFDGKPGCEIIIGCQVSDQVLRSVSVYSLDEGRVQQLLLVGYSKFLTCDFDGNGVHELMVLRPGETETSPGVAVLYTSEEGKILRSSEAVLSDVSSRIRRILPGRLSGGESAVLVSSLNEGTVLTDILTMDKGDLTNMLAQREGGGHIDTGNPFPVYPEDINGDGIVELPAQHPIHPVSVWSNDAQQSLLRWYALDAQGGGEDKLYSFHNFLEGWYLSLDSSQSQHISVVQGENVFTFYLWNQDYSEASALFSIFTFTGSNRNEELSSQGRFLIHSTETAIYAGKLEPEAEVFGITREYLTESFRLIRPDRRMN